MRFSLFLFEDPRIAGLLLAACGTLFAFSMTALGAALVFFFRRGIGLRAQQMLLGMAGGVMAAASEFSLLLPAMEQAGSSAAAVLPCGLLLGALAVFLPDLLLARCGARRRESMLFLAITLHNIPEGMAVGLAFALAAQGRGTLLSASALALGVGLQNLPEGAAVSLPLRAAGMSCAKGFFLGVLSGAAEPADGVAAALLASCVQGALPLLMAFAAGAMLLVTCSEMIPEAARSRLGLMAAAAGFALMMAMDVGLG